jgi:hypothetical protein
MTADLVVKLDAENRVTEITYAWKDFVPASTNGYDPQSWMQSDNETRVSMTTDLILRWRGGELREKLSSLSKLEECLGETLFVDEWRYQIGDWTALIVNFDKDVKVASAYIGDDD